MESKVKALELLRQTLDSFPGDTPSFKQWSREALNILMTCGFDDDDIQWFKQASAPTRTVIPVMTPGTPYVPTPDEHDASGAYHALEKILKKKEYLGGKSDSDDAASQNSGPAADGDSPLRLFDGLRLHPDIVEVSRSLFESGHYANAIFEAFKAVNNAVKQKSGLSTDGKKLMGDAFGGPDPVIKLNDGVTQSGKDEQEGFMHLFMGAMHGIRNPKGHDHVIQTDPYLTLEYLGFASLLMKKVSFWEAE